MRDIRFRAWDVKNKKWVEHQSDVRLECNSSTVFHLHLKDNKSDGYYGNCGDIEISQYTGSKDKNGKDIYEGDILSKSNIPGVRMIGKAPQTKIVGSIKKVIFHEGSFMLNTTLASKKYRLYSAVIWYYGLDVIGNIYENPELINTLKDSTIKK